MKTKRKPRKKYARRRTAAPARTGMDNKKLLLIGALGAGAILLLSGRLKAQNRTASIIAPSAGASSTAGLANQFPMGEGARGELVKSLQTALYNEGGLARASIMGTSLLPDGKPDGIFGPGTRAAALSAGYGYPVSYETFISKVK